MNQLSTKIFDAVASSNILHIQSNDNSLQCANNMSKGRKKREANESRITCWCVYVCMCVEDLRGSLWYTERKGNVYDVKFYDIDDFELFEP